MCRSFTGESVTREDTGRLIYAANRAPAAGNVRTAQIVIVLDSYTLEEIRKVSPGFPGACPLLLAVLTDAGLTQESDVASFDAGTIAENIALASVELGLGVCFLKSYPEKAVKNILKIPESAQVKIEVMICLGHPAQAAEKRKGPARAAPIRLFSEFYGTAPTEEVYNDTITHSSASSYARSKGLETRYSPGNGNADSSSVTASTSSLFDTVLFMLSSSRITIDESSRYGPKRLYDSLIKVLELHLDYPTEEMRPSDGTAIRDEISFLKEILIELRSRTDLRSSSMIYTQVYRDFLDDLLNRFVQEMERRRPNRIQ